MLFWKKEPEPVQEEQREAPQEPVHAEINQLLTSFTPDLSHLQLDRIVEYTIAINTYLKGLVRDLATYLTQRDEAKKQRAEAKISSVMKYLTIHGLELKNLIGHLEKHYYGPLLGVLHKLQEHSQEKIIKELEEDVIKDLERVKDIDTLLTRIIGYDALFNPEKNPEFKQDIAQEVGKNEIQKELEELSVKLNEVVLHKTQGLKHRIKEDPLQELKQKF